MDSSAISNSAAALRISIKAFERSIDSLEGWLYICVAMVVIGVAAEVAFVVREYCDEWDDFRRLRFLPHEPNRLKFWLELIGICLVVLGVAGEWAVDFKSGHLQTDLRNKNGELNQLLENVASEALSSAERGENEARNELSKARESLSPWNFDDAAQGRTTDKIKSFRRVPYSIAVDSHPYALDLMQKIVDSLNKAGWIETIPYGSRNSHVLFSGAVAAAVSATGVSIEAPPVGALADMNQAEFKIDWVLVGITLKDALTKEGLPVSLRTRKLFTNERGSIHIIVGRKP